MTSPILRTFHSLRFGTNSGLERFHPICNARIPESFTILEGIAFLDVFSVLPVRWYRLMETLSKSGAEW